MLVIRMTVPARLVLSVWCCVSVGKCQVPTFLQWTSLFLVLVLWNFRMCDPSHIQIWFFNKIKQHDSFPSGMLNCNITRKFCLHAFYWHSIPWITERLGQHQAGGKRESVVDVFCLLLELTCHKSSRRYSLHVTCTNHTHEIPVNQEWLIKWPIYFSDIKICGLYTKLLLASATHLSCFYLCLHNHFVTTHTHAQILR